jgi:hypothetical protein
MKMKKIILALSVSIALFSNCKKELPPVGLILTETINANDTTYVISTIPNSQAKAVFVEEFTGVRCSNCPQGAKILAQLQNDNPGRVIVAKVHNNILSEPIKTSDPDLRCTDADAIADGLGGLNSKPAATIDRLNVPGTSPANKFFKTKEQWASYITPQLTKSTPINIELEKFIDASTSTYSVKSKFIFTNADTNKLAYSAYILENGVTATQDSIIPPFNVQEIEDFEHEEVLRKILTPAITGTALPTIDAEAGRVYERWFSFTPPANVINKNKMMIVVFVHNVSTGEVIQAAELKLY